MKTFNIKSPKQVTSLQIIKVDEKGSIGKGIRLVSPEQVSYQEIEKFVRNGDQEVYLRDYPFKMIHQGKKYYMVCDEDGMVNNENPSILDFTSVGMEDVKFVYSDNDQPAHLSDLKLNGIVIESFATYLICFGKVVFIEDVYDTKDEYAMPYSSY